MHGIVRGLKREIGQERFAVTTAPPDWKHFGVRQTGVIVDADVGELAAGTVEPLRAASMDAMSNPVDPGQFLRVQVAQLAGRSPLLEIPGPRLSGRRRAFDNRSTTFRPRGLQRVQPPARRCCRLDDSRWRRLLTARPPKGSSP